MKIFLLYNISVQKCLYRALSDVSSVPNISYATYRRQEIKLHIFFRLFTKL
jgi:hypothetical protein